MNKSISTEKLIIRINRKSKVLLIMTVFSIISMLNGAWFIQMIVGSDYYLWTHLLVKIGYGLLALCVPDLIFLCSLPRFTRHLTDSCFRDTGKKQLITVILPMFLGFIAILSVSSWMMGKLYIFSVKLSNGAKTFHEEPLSISEKLTFFAPCFLLSLFSVFGIVMIISLIRCIRTNSGSLKFVLPFSITTILLSICMVMEGMLLIYDTSFFSLFVFIPLYLQFMAVFFFVKDCSSLFRSVNSIDP